MSPVVTAVTKYKTPLESPWVFSSQGNAAFSPENDYFVSGSVRVRIPLFSVGTSQKQRPCVNSMIVSVNAGSPGSCAAMF